MATSEDGGEATWNQVDGHARLPATRAIEGLAAGMAAAHSLAKAPSDTYVFNTHVLVSSQWQLFLHVSCICQ